MTEEIKVEEIVEEEVAEELIEAVEEEEALPQSVEIGGKEYVLYKTGGEQAQQVSDLLNWLGKYGENLAESLIDSEGGAPVSDAWSVIAGIGKVASKQALIDLFVVVIGCTPTVAENHFSIGTLIDGIQVLFSQEEYRKVLDRFF